MKDFEKYVIVIICIILVTFGIVNFWGVLKFLALCDIRGFICLLLAGGSFMFVVSLLALYNDKIERE
jgi:hypothetical protein